jgi:hypothetical protein
MTKAIQRPQLPGKPAENPGIPGLPPQAIPLPPAKTQPDDRAVSGGRDAHGRYRPGVSGTRLNPRKAAPAPSPELLAALAAGGIVAVSALREIATNRKVKAADRITASRVLLEHLKGKPRTYAIQEVTDDRQPGHGTTVINNVNMHSGARLTPAEARRLIRAGGPIDEMAAAEAVLVQAARDAALPAPATINGALDDQGGNARDRNRGPDLDTKA